MAKNAQNSAAMVKELGQQVNAVLRMELRGGIGFSVFCEVVHNVSVYAAGADEAYTALAG